MSFSPPVSRWTTLGGLILIGAVSGAATLATLVEYNVAVRASARVRPLGELRVVQTAVGGTVDRIEVQVNETVRQGEVIAQLDRTSLAAKQQQLQGNVQQLQFQRTQLDTQIQLMEAQIAAESRAIAQTVAAAEAELARSQQDYRERQVTAKSTQAEAEAALKLASSELRRYQQLITSGAISQQQLEEKRAAVETATAQVQRARATLNPSASPVEIAQRKIAQERSRGNAALATLKRERELLMQNRAELQAQLLRAQQALRQVELDLGKTVIRAVTAGVIFRLNLRNPQQVVNPGDIVAEIVPNTSDLLIQAQVATQEIDKVAPGQTVRLRIEACPYPEYGTLAGKVLTVAPDVTTPQGDDQRSVKDHRGAFSTPSHFEVTIQPQATILTNGTRSCQLQPGMEVEASIISRRETFLQFLMRQGRDQ